ncbi:hypothetical protein C7401_113161 [Paraburkholderia unamae]|uniref:hypothetical protein n=1 Tax=Paraburkholderia unamae TaxID=219649 RepID=UPI000DC3B871|nr:hypothetical protein [Paraburkholderia unamae]RAR58426.1 hypothetical protein C7401_113161 [Paraburkholderia unamae]
MRTRPAVLAALALSAAASLAHAQAVPTFEDCPATVETKHATPRIAFADASARRFQTVIRDAAKGPVNFAGHYILTTWGCGSGCVMAAVIDVKTGRTTSLPFTVSDWPLNVTEPLDFHANSCLLVVRGSRNESAEHGTYYYTFDGKAFRLRASTIEPSH